MKTTIKIIGNEILINWRTKKIGKGSYHSGYLEPMQIEHLKKYSKTNDFKHLGCFLNYPNRKNRLDFLVVAHLMFAFSNRKNINVEIDDSHADKISQTGIKEINKSLERARRKNEDKM